MDSHFHALMNTYDYEDALFRIDPNLKDFRDLKEMYVQFNSRNGGNPLLARIELEELILTYKSSRFEIFRDFASLLEKFEDPIVALCHGNWIEIERKTQYIQTLQAILHDNHIPYPNEFKKGSGVTARPFRQTLK